MCLAAGVNLIDTADVCSGGRAGEILGQVLRRRRDQVLVVTKVRGSMGLGRTSPVCPALTSSPAARPVCAAWAPTTST
jgi:aryl-alcohol dehydrogenase-like predicted oxidoreductase